MSKGWQQLLGDTVWQLISVYQVLCVQASQRFRGRSSATFASRRKPGQEKGRPPPPSPRLQHRSKLRHRKERPSSAAADG